MDIHQLRSWIFELFDPLENERQYIVFDAERGNLLVDVPPFSERALRLIRGAGRAAVLLVTDATRARDAHRYRETLGLQVAAHEQDAGTVQGGADLVLRGSELLRPDAQVLRVGATTVLLSRKAGGVLFSGGLDLASPAARALLELQFSAVLSSRNAPVWNAGRDDLERMQHELPKPKRRFGVLLQAPWDRSYRGRLEDQMTANPLIPTDRTAAREAAMGPGTLVVARAARELIERPARPAWHEAAARSAAAAPAAQGRVGRPRNFEENWDAAASPAPPTTIANAPSNIQPASGLHRPAALGARFRELPLDLIAGLPSIDLLGADLAGGLDLSPDGREVAFAWDRGAGSEICVAPLEGDRVFQLTEAGRFSTTPRWSPDGRWLAFVRAAGAASSLWLVDRDGAHESEVAPRGVAHAWSPDGRLAFVSGADLVIVDPRTRERRVVATGANEQDPPAWSPDASRLAYSSRDADGRASLFVVPSAGGTATRLDTTLAGDALRPRWSPDGTRLAFTARSDQARVAVAHLRDGAVTSVETIGSTPHDEGDAIWRPDLRGVLYLHAQGASVSVYRAFLPSHAATPIADRSGVHASPRPGPDSDSLVYLYTNATHPVDVWHRRARTVAARRVTGSSRAELDPEVLVSPVLVRLDGGQPALLYVPHAEAVKRQGKPPAIVDASGGHLDRFDAFAQVMANRGYVVIRPSVADAGTLIAAAAWLDQQGIADAARIGIVGGAAAGEATRRDAKRFAAVVADGASAYAAAEPPMLSLPGAGTRDQLPVAERVQALRRTTEWFDRHLQR